MEEKENKNQDQSKIKKVLKSMKPLVHLWPAAVAGAVVIAALQGASPELAEVPDLLTLDAYASDHDQQGKDTTDSKKSKKKDSSVKAEGKGTLEVTDFTEPEGGYKDGTYTGSATGFGGPITVRVVIKDGSIQTITIVSAKDETPAYLAKAKGVITKMISAQSPNVDAVSGATYSSNGIINAVKAALGQAAAGTSSSSNTEETSSASKKESSKKSKTKTTDPLTDTTVTMKDGTYTGSAKGFGGDIVVQVTIKDDKIVSIEITSAEKETPSFLTRAKALIPEIVEKQSTDVDVVSGATYSSNGIIEAVREAITKSLVKNSDPADKTDSSSTQKDTDTTGKNDGNTGDDVLPSAPVKYVTTNQPLNISACSNGVWAGESDMDSWYDYKVYVQLTIANGKITDMTVDRSHNEDDEYLDDDNQWYFDLAAYGNNNDGMISRILQQQSSSVDTITGATYSSDAILKAVTEALKKASNS